MKRTYSLVVAPKATDPTLNSLETGLNLSDLDFEFRVKKTLKPKPNTCKIKVWGLAPTSRRYLHITKTLTVRLEAGYDDENQTLFLGETRTAFSRREGADWATHIETGTSEVAMQTTGVSMTHGAGATTQDAYNVIQAALSQALVQSKKDPIVPNLKVDPSKTYYEKNVAIDRQLTRYLNDLARSCGISWSIVDGEMFLFVKKPPVPSGKVVSLSSDSGLIGSPSVDNKGLVDVKALMVPGLALGKVVYVDSEDFTGYFHIETIEYMGNTTPGAKEWYAKMTGTMVG